MPWVGPFRERSVTCLWSHVCSHAITVLRLLCGRRIATGKMEAAAAEPSSLTAFAEYSPVLRAAETLMPGGAALVCVIFALSCIVVLNTALFGSKDSSYKSSATVKREAEKARVRRRGPECALAQVPDGSKDKWDRQWRHELPAERYASLRAGEADPPNLPAEEGGLDGMEEDGIFACAGCDTPLYDNDFRFEAGCGWPCFYTCLDKAVRERLDDDQTRFELICNACNSHVGHIFRGEHWNLPPPGERHCVNSRSLKFIPVEGAAAHEGEEDDAADDVLDEIDDVE